MQLVVLEASKYCHRPLGEALERLYIDVLILIFAFEREL
jgi:hypothetical protein